MPADPIVAPSSSQILAYLRAADRAAAARLATAEADFVAQGGLARSEEAWRPLTRASLVLYYSEMDAMPDLPDPAGLLASMDEDFSEAEMAAAKIESADQTTLAAAESLMDAVPYLGQVELAEALAAGLTGRRAASSEVESLIEDPDLSAALRFAGRMAGAACPWLEEAFRDELTRRWWAATA